MISTLSFEWILSWGFCSDNWFSVKKDGLVIKGGSKFYAAEVDSETDHRVAMSLAIASLLAKGTSKINRSNASNVSYPSFWNDLENLLKPN